jgi:uncharacterized protein (TIGR00725 family)
MQPTKTVIGVIGGAEASEETKQLAYEVGTFIARSNAVLVTGGLSGVMEAASKGAFENDGLVVSIIPGTDKTAANPYSHVVIPSGLGISRNALVVNTADVIIAFPGSFGTLSEIGLALASNKPVVYMPGAWNLQKLAPINSSLYKEAFDAHSAVGFALDALRK